MKLLQEFLKLEKPTRRKLESMAKAHDMSRTQAKETYELSLVMRAREIANKAMSHKEKYQSILELHNVQANMSLRTSQSTLLQQYSTPIPIAYLMGIYTRINVPGIWFVEPSAGNGLLTLAGDPQRGVVNEIDKSRIVSLKEQQYHGVTSQPGELDFHTGEVASYYKNPFDALLTNPPFGKLENPIEVGGFTITKLEHWMAINGLSLLKSTGRAAIIVGGHTRYDKNGRVQRGMDSYFLGYLYHNYQVDDVIAMDGDLYKKQGTSIRTRLILISGRKDKPQGFTPLFNESKNTPVRDFDTLYQRVFTPLVQSIRDRLKPLTYEL